MYMSAYIQYASSISWLQYSAHCCGSAAVAPFLLDNCNLAEDESQIAYYFALVCIKVKVTHVCWSMGQHQVHLFLAELLVEEHLIICSLEMRKLTLNPAALCGIKQSDAKAVLCA